MAKITTDFSQIEALAKSISEQGEDVIEFSIPVIVPAFAFGVGMEIRETSESRNYSAIQEGCKDAMASAIAQALPQYLNQSISSNGLVDSGELKNSLSVQVTPSGLEIRYAAPYAALMHEGGYITPYGNPNAQKVFIPGRPWIDEAVKSMPMKEIAKRACVAYLASQGLT